MRSAFLFLFLVNCAPDAKPIEVTCRDEKDCTADEICDGGICFKRPAREVVVTFANGRLIVTGDVEDTSQAWLESETQHIPLAVLVRTAARIELEFDGDTSGARSLVLLDAVGRLTLNPIALPPESSQTKSVVDLAR